MNPDVSERILVRIQRMLAELREEYDAAKLYGNTDDMTFLNGAITHLEKASNAIVGELMGPIDMEAVSHESSSSQQS